MDATNQEVPSAGGQLSGDVSRQAAIKRLQKQATPNTTVGRPVQPPVQLPGKRRV